MLSPFIQILHYAHFPLLQPVDNYLEISISAVTGLLGLGGILLQAIQGQIANANLRNNQIALQQAEEAERLLGLGMNVTLFLVVSLAGIAFLQLFTNRIEPLGRRCTSLLLQAHARCCKSRDSTTKSIPGEQRYLEVFTEFDKDQSGSIDGDELLDVLRELGHKNATKAQADDLFVAMDADRNGVIDYEEFIVMAESLDLGVAWSSLETKNRSQGSSSSETEGRVSDTAGHGQANMPTAMITNPIHAKSKRRAWETHNPIRGGPSRELQVVATAEKKEKDVEDDLDEKSTASSSYDMSDLMEWHPSPRLPATPRGASTA